MTPRPSRQRRQRVEDEQRRSQADACREMADLAHAPHGVVRGHALDAINMMGVRLAEPWTLDYLAAEVHLSRSQLVRAFDAYVGMSPMAYLRWLRAQRMAQLLTDTDLSITEAARAVGWSDAKYASRCFRSLFDVSPTEFRRRQAPPPNIG